MGFKPSPYQTTQAAKWVDEMIRGRPSDQNNLFAWADVVMNLPGNDNYDPGFSWVYKVWEDGRVASDFGRYIDDVRVCAPNEDNCWNTGRCLATIYSHLGVQDAARKYRLPSLMPGAWAGGVTSTNNGNVSVTVTPSRWEKTKQAVAEIVEAHQEPNGIPYAMLESRRGFLVYVAQVYPLMKSFLKGIHLTLDSWQPGRDSEG